MTTIYIVVYIASTVYIYIIIKKFEKIVFFILMIIIEKKAIHYKLKMYKNSMTCQTIKKKKY